MMSPLSAEAFLSTAQGRRAQCWEAAQYKKLVENAFGYRALQVGLPSMNTLKANRIHSRWIVDPVFAESIPDPRSGLSAAAGLPEALPFADESFDLVCLPHTLDLSPNPQQCLREAVRVLCPQGRLVLTGFNPLSLWWLRQKGVHLGLPPYLPSRVVPLPLLRLKDWFSLLNLRLDRGHFGVYAPACHSETAFDRWRWLDKAGDRWAPHCANLIALSAVKEIPGVRLIGRKTFKKTPKLVGTPSPAPAPKQAR